MRNFQEHLFSQNTSRRLLLEVEERSWTWSSISCNLQMLFASSMTPKGWQSHIWDIEIFAVTQAICSPFGQTPWEPIRILRICQPITIKDICVFFSLALYQIVSVLKINCLKVMSDFFLSQVKRERLFKTRYIFNPFLFLIYSFLRISESMKISWFYWIT